MKYAKRINSIVCDDIREEKNNKISLMGVYGKEIIFDKLPALLPKLYIIIMLEGVKEKFSELDITLKLPGAKPQVFKRKIPGDIALGSNFNFMLGISPFRVDEKGEAIFEARIGDSKRTDYIHRLLIKERKMA